MAVDTTARILSVQSWNDYHLLTLDCPPVVLAAKPGQFVMVKVSSHPYPLLRRPLSIHFASGSTLELLFKTAGTGTALLSEKRPGDGLGVLGPLGHGFSLSNDLKGKTACLAGGGRGIAPLYFLARQLEAGGVRTKILYGGRSLKDLPLKDRISKDGIPVSCSTDDGTFGFKGLLTELFAEEYGTAPPAFLYSCGPEAMMKALAGEARRRGIPAEFSLESIMGCGIGACWGCVKMIRKDGRAGWVKICEDGPVFPSQDILWNEED